MLGLSDLIRQAEDAVDLDLRREQLLFVSDRVLPRPRGRVGRLEPAEVEMEARSEHDQRPKGRRHDCRDDLGDRSQIGVVVVL